MSTFTTYINTGADEPVEVEVEYNYCAATPGGWEEAPCSAELEMLSVMAGDVEMVDGLSDELRVILEGECDEDVAYRVKIRGRL